MAVAIEDQLFDVGAVKISEGAYAQAERLQRRWGRKGQEAVYVHTSLLLKLHATGQWGDIVREDRTTNRVNIARDRGQVLSVIGKKFPFVIRTELGYEVNTTFICVPEEV